MDWVFLIVDVIGFVIWIYLGTNEWRHGRKGLSVTSYAIAIYMAICTVMRILEMI